MKNKNKKNIKKISRDRTRKTLFNPSIFRFVQRRPPMCRVATDRSCVCFFFVILQFRVVRVCGTCSQRKRVLEQGFWLVVLMPPALQKKEKTRHFFWSFKNPARAGVCFCIIPAKTDKFTDKFSAAARRLGWRKSPKKKILRTEIPRQREAQSRAAFFFRIRG